MAQSDTVDRILDAAEVLFAERGFSETSLRMITSKAKVNLAAVNYHFGSKNALIQAVFSRFLSPFSSNLENELKRVSEKHAGNPIDIETLMGLVITCIIKVPTQSKTGVSVFMRLLGLAYTQSQGHLRKYLEQEYSRAFKLFMKHVREATPELSPVDRFWRIQFMLGTTAFTMSSIEALSGILENEMHVNSSTEEVVRRLVPFLAAGLQAPLHK
ncbi:TetR/AcrR family transcriptional regulator [Alkalimarinus alittae]|uniref:TetR family transcriptional regulator n=1 Tax=Alkalimarinus alittae TaxID=2961619 RepID=A0ABY6MY97_9ALTE|nr:TetR/AcrR family transcriptional regulator [Alkalimarinus alittae]UZE94747.1 TetR family transcriptional regulator [Alkalimarinus alittae]